MTTLQTEVLVIGGGATGAGVAWDAALRGFDVILVDRADLAEGTSGRFHGLLHSGGRYVVKDPIAAASAWRRTRSCAASRPTRSRTPAGCSSRRPTTTPRYGDRSSRAAARPALPAEEIPVAEALRREPRLNPGIKRAFTVPTRRSTRGSSCGRSPAAPPTHGARDPHLPPRHRRCTARATRVTGARLRNELHRRGRSTSRPGFMLNAVRRVGGADRRAWPGIEGVARGPRQGDHDRDEPPAGEHGGQPLHACPRTATSSSRSARSA